MQLSLCTGQVLFGMYILFPILYYFGYGLNDRDSIPGRGKDLPLVTVSKPAPGSIEAPIKWKSLIFPLK
jgi:hypothetical protein